MRHAIDTAPRDGKVVILEDDASGICDVAYWSAEAGEWIGKNGEPSQVTPTHWHPMPRDKYLLQEDEASSNPPQVRPSATATVEASKARTAPIGAKRAPRSWRRFAASSISATLIAAAVIGLYFYVTRYAGQQDIVRISTIDRKVIERETQLPSQDSRKTGVLALQQYAEADQARAQAGAKVRPIMEASAAEAQQTLDKEQRIKILVDELAEARRAIDARNLQIEARDLQLREVESELAMVRREIEANVALLAELQQERDRADALSQELAMAPESAQPAIDTRATLKHAANSQVAHVTQAVEELASKQPVAAVSQGGTDVAKLMARASALLDQGNISAARIVLERAAETGSALASFTLAETYDPAILSTWGTYGTRSDATKARELYAKAHARGIRKAKDRLDALDQ